MEIKELESILTIGETVAVEFKRCGNGIENDTYETVCSFLNRFGGDLFMGILDDGTVVGIPEKAAFLCRKIECSSYISSCGYFSRGADGNWCAYCAANADALQTASCFIGAAL